MRRLYQRYATDCYPTCIGMVADLSYAQAIRLVHPFRFKGSAYSTDDNRGIQVLRNLGFRVRKRYLKNFTKLKQLAIVIIVDPEGKTEGHAVVWDPVNKEILDPDRKALWTPISFYQQHIDYVLILT